MAFSPGISSTSRPLVIEIESDSVCDQAASAFCVSDARDGLRQTAAAAACPIRLDERKQCRQGVSQRIRRFLRGSALARSAREIRPCAPWCPGLVCDRHACAPSAVPPCRADKASSGSWTFSQPPHRLAVLILVPLIAAFLMVTVIGRTGSRRHDWPPLSNEQALSSFRNENQAREHRQPRALTISGQVHPCRQSLKGTFITNNRERP